MKCITVTKKTFLPISGKSVLAKKNVRYYILPYVFEWTFLPGLGKSVLFKKVFKVLIAPYIFYFYQGHFYPRTGKSVHLRTYGSI